MLGPYTEWGDSKDMRIKSVALTGAAALAFVVPGQAVLAQATNAAATAKPAPVSTLVKAVDIPYQTFTLKNGLRVVVHTDRKAPVVAVSVWYDVGSKHEPKGKTGFAHLFEHLMFNGSENAPGDSSRRSSRSVPPIITAPPISTGPIISRRCRPPRSTARCSWNRIAWAICSAR